MKRLFCGLMICVMLASAALAKKKEEYSFVRYGDSGSTVGALAVLAGCSAWEIAADAVFDDYILFQLIQFQEAHGLVVSGCFDLDTMALIFDISDDADDIDLVWIPMNGGTKYHKDQSCSKMIDPRQLAKDSAKALGFAACRRCK